MTWGRHDIRDIKQVEEADANKVEAGLLCTQCLRNLGLKLGLVVRQPNGTGLHSAAMESDHPWTLSVAFQDGQARKYGKTSCGRYYWRFV